VVKKRGWSFFFFFNGGKKKKRKKGLGCRRRLLHEIDPLFKGREGESGETKEEPVEGFRGGEGSVPWLSKSQ
jgi:hypothetical protein